MNYQMTANLDDEKAEPLGDTGDGETGVPGSEQGISNRAGDKAAAADDDVDEEDDDEDDEDDEDDDEELDEDLDELDEEGNTKADSKTRA
jgi:ribonuclease E